MKNDFGTTLKELMKEFGFRGNQLAKMIKVPNSRISRMVRNNTLPRKQTDLHRLYAAFPPEARTRLITAVCNQSRVGPGADLVKIVPARPRKSPRLPDKTEAALDYIHGQMQGRPVMQQFIIQLAEIMGAKS
jgi:hypothetical protein